MRNQEWIEGKRAILILVPLMRSVKIRDDRQLANLRKGRAKKLDCKINFNFVLQLLMYTVVAHAVGQTKPGSHISYLENRDLKLIQILDEQEWLP